ncbi:MAG: folate/biopterin family MFS transporter [Gammaproteobacteria bacterium]|nr:folate/biopterin family MFS transporter [Gammaproteobacteria bacterium]
MTDNPVWRWIDNTFLDLGRQFRWSYLPPLMIYVAAGVQGLTAIVGTFFIKEYLDLSAAFLAGLAFWAGIPWTLKMPIGHLVDLIWRRKALLVYIGASLIALSILIMYGIIAHTAMMAEIIKVEAWFVIATILAPTGYVVQDVVADAMTVEAVPTIDEDGNPYPESDIKTMHTTMQTLGRVAIIGGLVAVAALNITMFEGVENMSEEMKVAIYADIYLLALIIPLVSIMGVILGGILLRRRARQLEALGHDHSSIDKLLFAPTGETRPNWWILGGSLVFAVFTVTMGVSDVPLAQEIIFLGSMAIILFLMYRLLLELKPEQRNMLVGTAVIIFVFRAVPLPGPGAGWFEIDVLNFDQQFFSVLSLIASLLTLVGMVVLRPMMARRSIAFVVVLLTIAAGILSLPNIGLYYGLHEWTAPNTGGVVDARFIAIIDTAIESPLGQIAMIPMLAWIAKNAPAHLKATFFAVMASFTNLALSAASLGTKYMNEIYTVTREVRDRLTDAIQTTADYGELGWLLITVATIGVAAPLLTVVLIQNSRLRTQQ